MKNKNLPSGQKCSREIKKGEITKKSIAQTTPVIAKTANRTGNVILFLHSVRTQSQNKRMTAIESENSNRTRINQLELPNVEKTQHIVNERVKALTSDRAGRNTCNEK